MSSNTTIAASAVLLLLMGVRTAGSQQSGVDPAALPAGDGKTILARACTECHELTAVTAKRLTPRQWRDIVTDMASRGAAADDAEIATVIEYLAQNVGHVNVNKASEAELKNYGGFSAAEAAAIVSARTAGQTFAGLDDLKKVPGVDAKGLDARRDRIAFK